MGRIEKLPYKCGNLPNSTGTYSNNIYIEPFESTYL